MRKITRKAALAFRAGKNWSLDNTQVVKDQTGMHMYLHGNEIAYRPPEAGLSAVYVTLAGWGTPTTRERVNGLLDMLGTTAGYYQKNHCQMFTHCGSEWEVDSSDWIRVETRC